MSDHEVPLARPVAVLRRRIAVGAWSPLLLSLLLLLIVFDGAWPIGARAVRGPLAAVDRPGPAMGDFVAHYYPMGRHVLRDPRPVPGYFYTAFFALLLAPLGRLPAPAAAVVWCSLQVLAVVGLVAIARPSMRLSPRGTALYAVLCVLSYPVLHNLRWGQLSVPIVAGVLASFAARERGRSPLAGVLLGLLTAIKLYPALFVGYFLVRRDGRAVAAFIASAVAFYALVPALVLGPATWWRFERATSAAVGEARWIAADPGSQYLPHLAERWLRAVSAERPRVAILGGTTIAGRALGHAHWLVLLPAVGSWVLAWRLARRDGSGRPALAMAASFIWIPFVVPTSWPHYFSYLPFCQAALLSSSTGLSGAGRVWRRGPAALAWASLALSLQPAVALTVGWRPYLSWGGPFLANLAILLALAGSLVVLPATPPDGVSGVLGKDRRPSAAPEADLAELGVDPPAAGGAAVVVPSRLALQRGRHLAGDP